jgi:hypothetical protein
MNIITPIFPCRSLEELLDFYRTLGFTVTYQQKSPNPYAVVERGWIRLDFYGVKHHDPKLCYHTCYILADNTEELYEAFSAALRKSNGRLPARGLPRISEMRDKASGIREFMFSDIAGNCIRVGRKITPAADDGQEGAMDAVNKRLSGVLDFVYKSEDDPEEYEQVIRMLDKAIEKEKQNHCINLYLAMISRARIAIAQHDYGKAKALLQLVRDSPAITGEEEMYRVTLQRVSDLEQGMA